MTLLQLGSVTDWEAFSRAVRRLVSTGVAPEMVRWRMADAAEPGLFDAPETALREAHAPPDPPPLRLPRSFVEAARDVFLHADEDRFLLLHRMTAAIAADARAWFDPLDADRARFDRMLHEVHREIHKMHAFVRFRPVEMSDLPASAGLGRGDGTDGRVAHVAWFEPAHHVVERASGFFVRRFANMRWAILTPRVSVSWDGTALRVGVGTTRADAPAADAGEALWLDYYRSIFNPARLKVAHMKKEMPVRFWKNLPEAAAIGPMIGAAASRQDRMLAGSRDTLRRGTGLAVRNGPVMAASPLEALRRQATRCRDCPVADQATQVVFGEGDPHARLMIVGEQPGDEEDLRGRPFQGPAGRLLREAFERLGWDFSRLWVTNAVKHFHHELRGKRRVHKTPAQREADACLHWLEAEIEAVQPEAIVALGATAARSLLGRPLPITAYEGHWMERADGIPVLICLHPAALLRADESRRDEMQARWLDALRAAEAFACDADPRPLRTHP